MSYTFNVTHKSVPKKVTCTRSATVNDLILASLEKFKLLSQNGQLTYSGKKLDPLLPVRLTNLVNNAKLVLSVTAGGSDVTLKVAASIGDQSITKIIKLSPQTSLSGLVHEFRETAEVNADWSDKRIQLSVLQTVKDNLTGDFSATIGTLVGTSTNAVVRLLVEDKDLQQKRAKLQEQQRLLREQMNEKKLQERRLEKENAEKIAREKIEENREIEAAKFAKLVSPIANVPHSPTQDNAPSIPQATTPPEPVDFLSVAMVSPSHTTILLPEEREDTLYVPNKPTQIYENPDEDYNMTVNQAEKYYKIIKSMQGPAVKKEAVVPQKYIIRIRFPDRSLLDLPIEDPTIKLGQLLKKIDNYVTEPFINTYRLKNGLPPFKEIAIGFTHNNTPLQLHPDFQLEKLLLIWEPAAKKAGPYLKSGIATKDSSELPTLVLESHRGHLEQEEDKPVKVMKKSGSDGKKPNFPKWFKK